MLPNFIANKKAIVLIAAVLLIVAGGSAVAFRNGNDKLEAIEVSRHDLVETVNISGTVEADISSNLGFEVSGTVAGIRVVEGQEVGSGTSLANLTSGTLLAELKSAEANLALKKAQQQNTTINLSAIEQKQNILVENAYNKLLSSGLVAEARSASNTETPPTISGLYSGSVEGQYEFEVVPGSIGGTYLLNVFGLENHTQVQINKTGSTPLGTKGLYVSFPGDVRTYSGLGWKVEIPNKTGSSYSANFNDYQEVLRERERALEDAKAELRNQGGSSVAEAEILAAEAEVDGARAELAKRTLRAPFRGIVSEIFIEPGESVSAGQTAVSMISVGSLGIEVNLPEVDSVKVAVGDSAEVTLEAFESDLVLSARVVSVNRTETVVDGVSVYKARLIFEEEDARIASGMTADVLITTDSREDVLALPARAIKTNDDGSQYVVLQEGEETREVPVVTGLRSTDGLIEIKSGLKEGDTVLIQNSE